jgi:hypothetical protein
MQILRGSHIYEIGDHGGLIVLSPNDKETDTILYSWNEGLEFDDIRFVNNFTVSIDNIVTESSNME